MPGTTDVTGDRVRAQRSGSGRVAIVWTIVAVVALVGAVGASGLMAQRVAAFYRAQPRRQWVFIPVLDRTFRFAGREVTCIDEVDADGREWLRVRYGEAELRLRATVPPGSPQLPGLARHEPWLRMLRFAERTGMSLEQFERRLQAGELTDRLVIVTRTPMPGADPRTFGQAWHRDWVFDFYEFRPEPEADAGAAASAGRGTVPPAFAHQRLRYPESDRSYERRVLAARAEGQPPPARREDELRPGTWQFQAAGYLIPPHLMPDPGTGGVLTAAGWTVPAAVGLWLAAVVAGMAAAAPRRPAMRTMRNW